MEDICILVELHVRVDKQTGKLLTRLLYRYMFEIKLQLNIVSPVDTRYYLRQG